MALYVQQTGGSRIGYARVPGALECDRLPSKPSRSARPPSPENKPSGGPTTPVLCIKVREADENSSGRLRRLRSAARGEGARGSRRRRSERAAALATRSRRDIVFWKNRIRANVNFLAHTSETKRLKHRPSTVVRSPRLSDGAHHSGKSEIRRIRRQALDFTRNGQGKSLEKLGISLEKFGISLERL